MKINWDHLRRQEKTGKPNLWRRSRKRRGGWYRMGDLERGPGTVKKPDRSNMPDVERILSVTTPHFCAGAVFRRTKGKWRCTEAAPIIEWMTRVIHPGVIEQWLKSHQYEFQWLEATPVCSAKPRQTEQHSADLKNGGTVSSLNNKTRRSVGPGVPLSPLLAENGLANPRSLISGECSPALQAVP